MEYDDGLIDIWFGSLMSVRVLFGIVLLVVILVVLLYMVCFFWYVIWMLGVLIWWKEIGD